MSEQSQRKSSLQKLKLPLQVNGILFFFSDEAILKLSYSQELCYGVLKVKDLELGGQSGVLVYCLSVRESDSECKVLIMVKFSKGYYEV